ncbi:hypothetical protein AWENTII_008286 [Aspergillus wentii]
MAHHILLTGGNGFIGSHILAQLLDRGFTVCCPVRSKSKGDKILNDFSTQKSQIDISIIPDIVAPGAFDEVLTNSSFDTVIHTASPFIYGTVESNLEFLDPAIKGTLNLLNAVKGHAPSVKRVIYTSSCASVVNYDLLTSDPPQDLTEDDWNPIEWEEAVNGDQSKAYRASKKFAEQAGMFNLCRWGFHTDLCSLEIHGRRKTKFRPGDTVSTGHVWTTAPLHLEYQGFERVEFQIVEVVHSVRQRCACAVYSCAYVY